MVVVFLKSSGKGGRSRKDSLVRYPATAMLPLMRKRFEVQLALGQRPIERVVLPVRSRDELPPVLAGLQWIFQTPELNRQIFELLEKKVVGAKKATGRPGLDLWHILVLGVVRLALDCDYDRLEYLKRLSCGRRATAADQRLGGPGRARRLQKKRKRSC